jgi:hypothetical protein
VPGVLPRPSAHVSQIGATRGHPIYIPGRPSFPPCRNYCNRPLLLPSRSFRPVAWAIPTCHAHASRHSLQPTKHNHHHLATLSSSCHCSLASTATHLLMYLLRRTSMYLFPLFFLLPSPPLSPPRSNNASSGRRLHTSVGLRSPN